MIKLTKENVRSNLEYKLLSKYVLNNFPYAHGIYSWTEDKYDSVQFFYVYIDPTIIAKEKNLEIIGWVRALLRMGNKCGPQYSIDDFFVGTDFDPQGMLLQRINDQLYDLHRKGLGLPQNLRAPKTLRVGGMYALPNHIKYPETLLDENYNDEE